MHAEVQIPQPEHDLLLHPITAQPLRLKSITEQAGKQGDSNKQGQSYCSL